MKNRAVAGLMITVAVALIAWGCSGGTGSRPAQPENAEAANMQQGQLMPMNHDMGNMNGHDMANMDHDMSMMQSAPGAAQQPYDLQFIDTMIYHHQGAIRMADMVLSKTERSELKTFAQKIKDDQSREIDQLKQWRDQWYAGKPSALNMEMPGMMNEGMKAMNGEHMKTMSDMEPAHFDNHFLNMMTPHHEGAIAMANEALKKAEHQEIKDLAGQIIKAQQAEIKQMQQWKAQWKK